MPTYQYSCTECGHFFEQVQSFSEDSLTVCPQCEGRLRKVFNAVGVVFKGSGFYRTDSRAETRAEGGTAAAGAKDGATAAGSSDGGKGAGSGEKAAASAPAAGASASGGSGGGSSSAPKASSGSSPSAA